MRAGIFSAEVSALAGRAGHNGAMSADQRSSCDAVVPCMDWGVLGASDHIIQVYEEDAHFLDAVAHGGQITVQSTEGHGTVCTITLPRVAGAVSMPPLTPC